jgi:hypothetical protein
MSGGVDMDKHVSTKSQNRRSDLPSARHRPSPRRSRRGRETQVFGNRAVRARQELKYLREAGYDIVADKAACLPGTDDYCSAAAVWYDMA